MQKDTKYGITALAVIILAGLAGLVDGLFSFATLAIMMFAGGLAVIGIDLLDGDVDRGILASAFMGFILAGFLKISYVIVNYAGQAIGLI